MSAFLLRRMISPGVSGVPLRTTFHDTRCAPLLVACDWCDRNSNLFNMPKRGALFVIFLLVAAMSAAAEDHVWEVDLRPYMKGSFYPHRVWFQGKYLVVEPSSDFCHDMLKASVDRTFLKPQDLVRPVLPLSGAAHVFDVNKREEVSVDIFKAETQNLDEARAAACPQLEELSWVSSRRADIPVAWNQALLRRNGSGGIDIDRPGQPEVSICERCLSEKTIIRFVAPERVLIAATGSDLSKNARVLDLQGKEKFQFDLKGMPEDAYVVFDRSGTRFAVTWIWQSGLGHLRYFLDDYLSDGAGITYDRKIIQVFSTVTGQRLYKNIWHSRAEASGFYDSDNSIAFSGDGSLLAYVNAEYKIVIMKVPQETGSK